MIFTILAHYFINLPINANNKIFQLYISLIYSDNIVGEQQYAVSITKH